MTATLAAASSTRVAGPADWRTRILPPTDGRGGWAATLVVGLLAGLLRVVRLDLPAGRIFDEIYYVCDAQNLLRFGVEAATEGGSAQIQARCEPTGEAGFVVPSTEFVRGLRRICDEHGIVLVADEVQTGFCRTGRTFAIEHFGIEPDLVAVAKSIAAGVPLSGVLGRAEIMDAPGDSAIGGTYVGNPVAIAAAHAVLDVIDEERLNERAEVIDLRYANGFAVRAPGVLEEIGHETGHNSREIVRRP